MFYDCEKVIMPGPGIPGPFCGTTYQEALELVYQGKADVLGAFLGSEEDGADMGLALSKAYASISSGTRGSAIPRMVWWELGG